MDSAGSRAADSLDARLAAVVERHTRLLALRLTAVVDELQERNPQMCDDPVFTAAWDRFASFGGSTLRAALEEPALEAWIGHVETLLRSPVLDTCPGHHVPRTLARFSALLLNLASCEEAASEGTAVVMGGASVPILLGSAQLRPPSVRRTVVHWLWNGTLHLRDEQGTTLVELQSTGQAPGTTGHGWQVERTQRAAGVSIFTQPRCVEHPQTATGADFPTSLARAARDLGGTAQSLLRLGTRAAGPRCHRHPLKAYSWLGVDPVPTAQGLVHGLASNLVGRCAALHRFDASRELTETLGAGTPADVVAAVAGELMTDEAAAPDSMVERVLAASEGKAPDPPSAPAIPEPGAALAFEPVLARAGIPIENEAPWTQRKSRRRDTAPRWRVLDALEDLSLEQIDRLRSTLSTWPDPEIRHFGLACLDYHQGRFPAVAGHALACIESDRACEDHWFLLAFSVRHLRQYDTFDDIVFASLRSDAVLERVRRSL